MLMPNKGDQLASHHHKYKMARVTVNIDIGGRLRRFANNLEFSNTMKEGIGAVKKEAELNFTQGGRIYGTWKPLAASTRKDRKRKGFSPNRPILVRTGKLKKGFVTKSGRKDAEMTNEVKYMATHQQGTRKVPQRQIMGISDKAAKAIAVLGANEISKQLRRAL